MHNVSQGSQELEVLAPGKRIELLFLPQPAQWSPRRGLPELPQSRLEVDVFAQLKLELQLLSQSPLGPLRLDLQELPLAEQILEKCDVLSP
jgi:hypothetical protein